MNHVVIPRTKETVFENVGNKQPCTYEECRQSDERRDDRNYKWANSVTSANRFPVSLSLTARRWIKKVSDPWRAITSPNQS